MPVFRIVYELVGVAYSGDNLGDDWTFYVHTGAGLVCFNHRLRRGDQAHRRVIGVRELQPSSVAVEFEREMWWASATEHDSAVPEHGAGLFTPVAIPLEAGVELRRTLEFNVAEPEVLAPRNRVAHLRFDIRARVERSADAPAPPLEVTALVPDAPVPTPERTAGELPARFKAEVEGVTVHSGFDDNISVVAECRLLVGRDHVDNANDARADALANFLTHYSGGFLPAWFEPRAALYEIRNRDNRPFWAGENSSMGRRNHLALVRAFAEAAPPLAGRSPGGGAGGFERRPSLISDLLSNTNTSDLAPSAAALAELIATLVGQHPERAPVDRELFVRTTIVDEHSGEWTRVLFVDPTPFSGPDELLWMVEWTDAWTE